MLKVPVAPHPQVWQQGWRSQQEMEHPLHELIATADTWMGSMCPGGLIADHGPAKLLMPVLIKNSDLGPSSKLQGFGYAGKHGQGDLLFPLGFEMVWDW